MRQRRARGGAAGSALIPGVKRVTFKYALGADFIEKLKFLHDIGLDRTEPVTVRGVDVSPRDVVAAVVPDPIRRWEKMVGRAICRPGSSAAWTRCARSSVPDGRRARDDVDHALAGGRLADRLQPGAGHEPAGQRHLVRSGVLGPEASMPLRTWR